MTEWICRHRYARSVLGAICVLCGWCEPIHVMVIGRVAKDDRHG